MAEFISGYLVNAMSDEVAYHDKPVEEALRSFSTGLEGLTATEAAVRLENIRLEFSGVYPWEVILANTPISI